MARGVAGEAAVTKYGSKTNPGKGHYYKWESGKAGEGVGKCMHCSGKLKFEPKGTRGGKVRVYWKDGKWGGTEGPCKRKAKAN